MQVYLATAAARWAASRRAPPPAGVGSTGTPMVSVPVPYPCADAAFVAAAAAARPASIPGLGAAIAAVASRLQSRPPASASAATSSASAHPPPPSRRLGHAAGPTPLSEGLAAYLPVATARAARPTSMVVAGSGRLDTLLPRDAAAAATVVVLAARYAAYVADVAASAHKRRRLDNDAAGQAVVAYALPAWYHAFVVPAVLARQVELTTIAAAAVASEAAAVVKRYALAPDVVARRVASKRYARARRLRAAAAATEAATEAAAASEMRRRRAVAGIVDAVQSGSRAADGGDPGTPPRHAGLVAFRYDRGEGAFAFSGGICSGGGVRRRQLEKYATEVEVEAPGGVAGAVGFAKTAPMFHTKVMNRWA
ncbi:hypothetical protein BU14_0159s0045 [Porphyra umbilicalis]|uniref:Uncharacterized protein n=1 Tax=Porphyra umbilicalis TaxID=2786 RepID=A0A1X6P8H1_PORUM|nr:hypothetical protein BU14_0159s0045 [Porphyra umbilicalis]|eukprot:OSX77191.1 hypothetical protein BU14_0159s0045 [Porphyra umbilicalis]